MQKSAAPRGGVSLDPLSLGRPLHLLDRFTALARDDLDEAFRSSLNRRYRAQFEVAEVRLAPLDTLPERGRWTGYAHEQGRIDFTLDRSLLLEALDYRYGSHPAALGSPRDAAPVTATEERLAALLGRRFVGVLVERLEGRTPSHDGSAHTGRLLADATTPLRRQGAWALRVAVRERVHDIDGAMYFLLEDAWQRHLLQQLAPLRERPAESATAQPFAHRLPLALTARLLEKDIPLGRLLDLKVGDVIPVSMGVSDVLIDDSRVFTAQVVEHKGKLCLTAFEDVE
ncbi:MAG: FliM/FliN family flagellar motor switch protein [Proteobacteria bacterium]|nr:FliM/FliN family flagellar motor switch protein [Pseudomonadota bacterium]